MSFEGKFVVITGGAGGIGLATAQQFLAGGAKVLLVDLKDEALKEAKSKLNNADNVYTFSANVSKEEEVKAYVDYAKEVFGKIDIFFNNAGINGPFNMITELESKDFDAVIDVNVKGVFYGLKYVLKEMKSQGSGAVVNTASLAGMIETPGMAAYGASKHAVIGLTKTAANEVAGEGIRVNSVCPAPVDTNMMRAIETNMNPDDSESVKTEYSNSIPLKRYAEAEEIANVVIFLASDGASYVTSSHYTVDGGMTPN
ncbi:SDR family NAD(P)-dependent oxidoreductase [Halalkalibacillus halophilus]|uniref:SDR family NAD(P)-dependent oxidoreductase n=1 Tax=Halalkalibacillus halophilus TaxID=392827 RepID=UPI000426C669|nr:SDR family NAD(P)-dependent oxidoreductase [Halalkalibacillus halophilus]